MDLNGDGAAALRPFLLERCGTSSSSAASTRETSAPSRTARSAPLSPLIARRKLEVLPEFTSSADFTQLATAFKRVRNIARELPAGAARRPRRRSTSRRKLSLRGELEQRRQVIDAAIAAGDYRRGVR